MFKRYENNDYGNYLNLAELNAALGRKIHRRYIEYIIDAAGDVNYQLPESEFFRLHRPELIGCTALHLAFSKDHFEIFDLLLEYGSHYNIKNDSGMTVVHRAIEENFQKREMLRLRRRFNKYAPEFTVDDVNGFVMMKRVIERKFNKHDNWRLWGKFEDRYVKAVLKTQAARDDPTNPVSPNGISHFHAACLMNDKDTITLFLKYRVDLNQRVNDDSPIFAGFTPLHFAVRYCDVEIVRNFLACKPDLSIRDAKGMTPLHVLLDQNFKIIEWIHAKDQLPYKNSATDYRENDLKMQVIMHNCEHQDDIGLTKYHVASALYDNWLIRNFWLEEVNNDDRVDDHSPLWPGFTPLHFAAFFNLETVTLLIKRGADVESQNGNEVTPMDILTTRAMITDIHFILCSKKSWKRIKLSDGKTKLIDLILAMEDPDSFAKFLKKIDVNVYIPFGSPLWPGRTILHLAVMFAETTKKLNFIKRMYAKESIDLHVDHANCVREQFDNYLYRISICMSKGADVNAMDARSWTPINLAFRYRQYTAVNLMMQHHTNLNPIDHDGLTHMHIKYACAKLPSWLTDENKNAQVLPSFKWLGDYYSCTSTDVFDLVGSTFLHLAVSTRSLEIFKKFPKIRSVIKAKDTTGLTALHRAFVLQHIWTVGNELYKDITIKRQKRLFPIPGSSKAMASLKEISTFLLRVAKEESIVDGFGLSYSFIACYENNTEALEKLLDLGSDINAAITYPPNLDVKHPLYFMSCYDGNMLLHCTHLQYIPDVEKILLVRGADFLAKRPDGMNRLFDKLDTPYPHDIQFLIDVLEKNEAVRTRLKDEFGWTILHVACRLLVVRLAQLAFKIGVDVNARTDADSPIYPDCTALHLLMTKCKQAEKSTELKKDHACLLDLLLDNGADVLLTDPRGNTPLHLSGYTSKSSRPSYENSVYTDRLMKHIKDFTVNPINDKGISLFHIACIKHDVATVKNYLDNGVDVDRKIEEFSDYLAGYTPLHLAAMGTWQPPDIQLQTIELLMEFGASVVQSDVCGYTILHFIADSNLPKLALMKKIVETGANIQHENIYGQTPLEVLLSTNQATPEGIEFFIVQGCRMNYFNEITLAGYIPMMMSYGPNLETNEVLKTALSCPFIEEPDRMGRTVIHNVVSTPRFVVFDEMELIEHLLRKGFSVDDQDKLGRTPLHLATQFRNTDAIEGLLTYGADVNIVDAFRRSAFAYTLRPEPLCELIEVEDHDHESVLAVFTRYMFHLVFRARYINESNQYTSLEVFDNIISMYAILASYMEIMNESIGTTSLTLGDFFCETGAIVRFHEFSVNEYEQIVQFFTETINHCNRFDQWRFLCNMQYVKARERFGWVRNAKSAMDAAFGIPMPGLIYNTLEKYLSNEDLKILIRAKNRIIRQLDLWC